MTRRYRVAGGLCLAVALDPSLVQAQEWVEMTSPHFVVVSNAGPSQTRTLVWQFEQIRSAIATMFDWARVDPDRPVAIYAVKDERSMRALAPEYWERQGGMRPVSVWVSAADRHYLAIRSDVKAEDRDTINPHINAYYSYASLILQHSIDHELPLWFMRGFAGVLSNTIVRDTYVLLGPPIPWHLDRLRERSRLRLAELTKVTRSSPEYTSGEALNRFDAQSWALVHFLMFGDNGARRSQLDQFTALVAAGKDFDAAMRESLGRIEDLEGDYYNYIGRSLYTFNRVNVDASVPRENLPSRPLSASEIASAQALFHVAMDRPVEARAAIQRARKTAPDAPDSFLAEALMHDREEKRDEARAAFQQAVDGGSSSAYAHYRLAALRWRSPPDRDTLTAIEKLLSKAIALNSRHAASNAYLGEVRSLLGSGEPLPFVRRAIALAPTVAAHRLTAARVLLRRKAHDEALREARTGLTLARSDEDRRDAEALIASIERVPRQTPVQSSASNPPEAIAPVKPGPGVVNPRLRKETKPSYTADAMRMRLQGVVRLETVVLTDGTVGSAKAVSCDLQTPLSTSRSRKDANAREELLKSKYAPGSCAETFGLAEMCIKTLKEWQFTPGTKDGVAVPVLVEVEMTFRLR